MVNSTFPRPIGIDSSLCLLSQHTWRRILPRPIGIDSPLCLLSQHTWRRILPRRCHLDRRRGGCCPATATGANPHHVRRRPERLNCCRPSPFSVACPVLPFVSLTLRYTRLFVQLSRESQLIRSGLYPNTFNITWSRKRQAPEMEKKPSTLYPQLRFRAPPSHT